MALSSARLSTALQTAIAGVITVADAAQLKKICDAIAQSVVTEITGNAAVTVTGVQGGGGSAPGTVS